MSLGKLREVSEEWVKQRLIVQVFVADERG